jgi:hypothetical protein
VNDLDAALDAAIAETGVERYRYLATGHPDPAVRRAYTEWILAGRPAHSSPINPPILAQAANVLGAVVAFATSGFKTVDQAEQGRRLAICHECEFFDHEQVRCRKCGCFANLKARLATEHCPIDKW